MIDRAARLAEAAAVRRTMRRIIGASPGDLTLAELAERAAAAHPDADAATLERQARYFAARAPGGSAIVGCAMADPRP